MSRAAWFERLRRAPSPLLVQQLTRAGLSPAAFCLEDLPRLEPLAPAELDLDRLADPVAYLRLADAPPPNRLGTCERAGATIVLTWTAADLRRTAAAGARALRAAGIAPGMKVANTLPGGFSTPGSLGLGDALEDLGALDIPLGPAPDEKTALPLLALIERIGVEVLVLDAVASAGLVPLLEAHAPRSLKGVLWFSTVAPPLGAFGVWLRRWISVPEVSTFAIVECASGGLHLDADLGADLVAGRLVLSAFGGDAPVLRYDSGIEAESVGGPCRCGDSRPRFEPA